MLDVYQNLINQLRCKFYFKAGFDTDYCSIFSSPKQNSVILFHLQIRLEESEWSFPFPLEKEGIMDIIVRHGDGRRQSVRLDVRGYDDGSRFVAIFQLGSSRGPYRYVEIQLLKPYRFSFRSYMNLILEYVR